MDGLAGDETNVKSDSYLIWEQTDNMMEKLTRTARIYQRNHENK